MAIIGKKLRDGAVELTTVASDDWIPVGDTSDNDDLKKVSPVNIAKMILTTDADVILDPAQGGNGCSTVSISGPVTVTTTLNRQTYVATGAVEYDLPTGDLSAYVAIDVVPLKYVFVKSTVDTLTIDPGSGNFIANGAAAEKLYNDVSDEVYATVTLQLISSATSVNKWVIIGAHGTWII